MNKLISDIDKKHHYVYRTINLLNGMEYIGVHSTNNLADDYIGSGTYLRHAIRKHGRDKFKKEIIRKFKSRDEALSYEAYLVDEAYIGQINVYNLVLGGNVTIGRNITIKKFKKSEEKELYSNFQINKLALDERKYNKDYHGKLIEFFVNATELEKYRRRIQLIKKIKELSNNFPKFEELQLLISEFLCDGLEDICKTMTLFYNDKRFHKKAMSFIKLFFKKGFINVDNTSFICIREMTL